MRKFIIMGIQGSGKGTQAKLLADDLDVGAHQRGRHLPVERPAPHQAGRPGQAHHGQWPAWSTTTWSSPWSEDRLADHDWNYGFIIDGFPRNARQAEFFLESYDIDGVINLDLPDEEVHAAGPGPAPVPAVRPRLQPHGPPTSPDRTPATSAAATW